MVRPRARIQGFQRQAFGHVNQLVPQPHAAGTAERGGFVGRGFHRSFTRRE